MGTTPFRARGGEAPMSAWLRSQPGLDAQRHSLAVSDVDYLVHHFKTAVDGQGTREVQCLLNFELKSFGRQIEPVQLQTLWIEHQRLCDKTKLRNLPEFYGPSQISVWHFGWFVLSLTASTPDDSRGIRWSGFGPDGRLWSQEIDRELLTRILRFERRPDRPSERLSLRRHHKNSELWGDELQPLGFVTPVRVELGS